MIIKKEPKMTRKFYSLVSCAIAVILFYPNFVFSEPSNVVILDPLTDGETVGRSRIIKGTGTIKPGHFLWVLSHRKKGYENFWWPQGRADIDPKTNEWEVQVTFGEKVDENYNFEVAVIIVGEKSHKKLTKHFSRSMLKGEWLPMEMPQTISPPVFRIFKKVSH